MAPARRSKGRGRPPTRGAAFTGQARPRQPARPVALPRPPAIPRPEAHVEEQAPIVAAESAEVVARAKINLFLAVGPRRDDGYHELTTVMQTVDLTDELSFRRAEASSVTFRAGRGFQGPLPAPPDLVEQALGLAGGQFEGFGGAVVEVTKVIPLAAGLAGGSADAAAALLAADAIAGAGTPRGQLEALCRRIGADVAFCLRGGTVLARGRGDHLAVLACRHHLWWVLGIPDLTLSTPEVYRRFDQLAAAHEGPADLGRPNKLVDALAAGHPKAIAPLLRNDLEGAAFDLAPSLPAAKAALIKAGALNAIVSGSGPAIAGICRDEAHAEEVAARAEAAFARVEVVASTPLGAEIVARTP